LPSDGEDFLAGGGAADDDAVFGEGVIVEGVEGLAEFHEDVVGDIDDVVDGAEADGFEAQALEPFGEGPTLTLRRMRAE